MVKLDYKGNKGTVTIDPITLFFSYSDCVGYRYGNLYARFIDKKYSPTTSKHVKEFVRQCVDVPVVILSEEQFNKAVENALR